MFLAVRLVAALGVTATLALFDIVARPSEAQAQAMTLPVDATPLVVQTGGGDRRFTIEVADDAPERTAGLMYRTAMPDDRGMLFILDNVGPAGFWMKNTPMPLDLLFIGADRRVKAIMHGVPQSEALIAPGEPVQFVLELKAGTAERNGIAPGDLVAHPAIARARGDAG